MGTKAELAVSQQNDELALKAIKKKMNIKISRRL